MQRLTSLYVPFLSEIIYKKKDLTLEYIIMCFSKNVLEQKKGPLYLQIISKFQHRAPTSITIT